MVVATARWSRKSWSRASWRWGGDGGDLASGGPVVAEERRCVLMRAGDGERQPSLKRCSDEPKSGHQGFGDTETADARPHTPQWSQCTDNRLKLDKRKPNLARRASTHNSTPYASVRPPTNHELQHTALP
eukprot:5783878-Prymnesium_polylepis.1